MKVLNVRHKRHEAEGFCLYRPNGLDEYVFLHFYNPVTMHTDKGDLRLEKNACLIYNIKTPQSWTSESELCHDWMHIDKSFGEYITRYGIPTDTVIYPSDVHSVSRIMTDIEYEFFNSLDESKSMTEVLLQELCIILKRSSSAKIGVLSDKIQLLDLFANLRIRIHSSPEKHWTVAMMAKEVKFSVSGFHRMYKALFSVSPAEDLINSKIESAKYYLQSTALNVNEIAVMLGYSNTTHFCRQFKARNGISANEYRKNCV